MGIAMDGNEISLIGTFVMFSKNLIHIEHDFESCFLGNICITSV
jgi:hypothetical protein